MKERPILFSGPMVRAILDGRKTQTRRIVKPQPRGHNWEMTHGYRLMVSDIYNESRGRCFVRFKHSIPNHALRDARFYDEDCSPFCPYGQPGDRLWVRESWRTFRSIDHVAPRNIDEGAAIDFLADEWTYGNGPLPFDKGKIRPSIHMPRWASRITLEITGVRVERLQDISRGDAIAEGVDWKRCPTYQSIESFTEQRLAQKLGMACFPFLTIDYIGGYKRLWESINGPGSWNENPWVWVVEFRKVDHIPGATKKV